MTGNKDHLLQAKQQNMLQLIRENHSALLPGMQLT